METAESYKGRFSYSKLNQYQNCPFAFYQKYVLGNFIDQPSIAAEFGSLVHKIEETITNTYLKGEQPDYEALKKTFVSSNRPKVSKDDRDGDIYGIEVLSRRYPREWVDFASSKSNKSFLMKAQDYLTTGMYRQEQYLNDHPELELVGAEIEFRYNYRGYLFYGFIDRLLRYRDDHNHYVIHDIKTKDHPFADSELTTPLQFVIYCAALRSMYGEDSVIDCYYDLPIANLLQKAGTRGFEKRGFKKIDQLIDGIEAADYTPHPTPLCYWCNFSNTNPNQPAAGVNKCPYYSLWLPNNKTFDCKLPWLGLEKHALQVKKLEQVEEEEGQITTPKKFEFDF